MMWPLLPRKRIHMGDIAASREPLELETTLGSCIAVCLFDREVGVGGMNHFLLPRGQADAFPDAQFGVHAMDVLIGAMQKLGAHRANLEAKIFGGAHLLKVSERPDGVARSNIRFIQEFLLEEDIPLIASDVGGTRARIVRFSTSCGRARVRTLGDKQHSPIVAKETRVQPVRRADTGRPSIELFGDDPCPARFAF